MGWCGEGLGVGGEGGREWGGAILAELTNSLEIIYATSMIVSLVPIVFCRVSCIC